MANIIPMAGFGSRFVKHGYQIPKPLIEVLGEPMVVQVIRRLPASDKWIFLVRQEHIELYQLDEIITRELPDAIIVATNSVTTGQATTCLLAQGYVEPDEPLLIGACDSVCLVDDKEYKNLLDDPSIDCIVWTCTKLERMRQTPHLYGWVRLAGDTQTIEGISVKVPISDNSYMDHGIVATFDFKRSSDCFEAINLMIREKYMIKGEYYLDAVPIFLQKMNKRSVKFDVNQLLSWGTPQELQEFESWREIFRKGIPHTDKNYTEKEYLYWKEIFE
ncbi:NTP transferase domain-containing protein [Gammaproteobacteria bacterium]|nr:NTP transferase domain-containing protein [Gammaproteobacteria bacterium]